MKNIVKHIINFFKYIVLGGSIGIMTVCFGLAMMLIVAVLLASLSAPLSELIGIACMSLLFIICGSAWYDITDDLRKALWR